MRIFDFDSESSKLDEQAAFVRRLACRLIDDRDDVDDVVQEAALARLRRVAPARNERAWLTRVTINLSLLRLRGRTRRRTRETVAARSEELPAADEALLRESARSVIEREVAALREPYRSTILLLFYEGLAVEEIAARQGCSIETVRTRRKRALALLRERLAAEYGGERRLSTLALLALIRELRTPLTPARSGRRARMARSTALAGAGVIALLCVAAVAYVGWRADRPPIATRGAGALDVARAPDLDEASAPDGGTRVSQGATAAPGGRPAFRIEGRVVDPSRRPVARARIGVFPPEERSTVIHPDAAWEQEIASDEEGRFELFTELDDAALEACSERATTAEMLMIERGSRDQLAGIELVLVPSFAVTGRVVDELGRPVADVGVVAWRERIRSSNRPSPWDGCWFASRKYTTASDEQGLFRFDALPRSEHVVEMRWVTDGADSEVATPDAPDVTLVTRARVVLTTRVLAEDGSVVPDASVRAFGGNNYTVAQPTDASGVAVLAPLQSGRGAWLRVDAPQRAPQVLELREVGPDMLTVRMEPGRPVSGIFRGEGASELRVRALFDLPWEDLMRRGFAPKAISQLSELCVADVDAQGGFAFATLPASAVELLVEGRNGEPALGSMRLSSSDERAVIDLDALERERFPVEVRVRGSDGRSVGGATVFALPTEGGRRFGPQSWTSSPDGRASLSLVEAGQWYLWIVADGCTPVFLPYSARPDQRGPERVDVRLAAARTLRVELRDRAGAPLSDVDVYVRDPAGRPVLVPTSRTTWIDRMRTSARGELLLDRIPDCPIELGLALPGRGTLCTRSFEATVAPLAPIVWSVPDFERGGERRPGRLILHDSAGGRVDVRVLDAGGALVSDWAGRIEGGALHADELPAVHTLSYDARGRPAWAREEPPESIDAADATTTPDGASVPLLLPIGTARFEVTCGGTVARIERTVPAALPGEAVFEIRLDLERSGH